MRIAGTSCFGVLPGKRFVVRKSALLAATCRTAFLSVALISAAQDPPRTGTYAILSGTYREVGGFVGILEYPLPQANQAYIALVTTPTNQAQLLLLDASQHASKPWLTNGSVSGNTIEFHYQTQNPILPTLPPAGVNYTVSNSAGALWINGSITSTPVCCDIPYCFEHSNVVARFLPVLGIRTDSGVELAWTSASNQNYQLEYVSNLTQAAWTNLGAPLLGTGTTNSLMDVEAPAAPQRFYRIRVLP